MATTVRPGQVWEDTYPDRRGRQVKVLAVNARYATVMVIRCADGVTDTAYFLWRTTQARLGRFYTGRTGRACYRLVTDVPVDETAEPVNRPLATWTDEAACKGKDPSLWDLDTTTDPETALRICSACPVLDKCALAAVDDEMYGVIQAGKILFKPIRSVHDKGTRVCSNVGMRLIGDATLRRYEELGRAREEAEFKKRARRLARTLSVVK